MKRLILKTKTHFKRVQIFLRVKTDDSWQVIRRKLVTLSRKQQIVFGLVLLLGLGGLAKSLLTSPPPVAKEVAVEPVASYALSVQASGRIQPASEVYVSVKKGGRLDQILVEVGAAVAKDQLIAVVDETMNRSAIESALANYRLAGAESSRIQSLFRSSSATAQEVDQARAQLSTRRAELEQARQKLEDGLVRSPIAGHLALLPFQRGDTLPDGARVAVIEDRSGYYLRASLPIVWLGRIPPKAEAKFAKYGSGALTGESAAALPTMICDISSPPAETTAAASEFDVELKFSDLPAGFSVGDLTAVSIHIGNFDNLLRIPSSSLTYINQSPAVLTQKPDSTLEFRTVEIIHGDNESALVKNNLGDVVVLEAQDQKKVQEAILKKSHPKVARKAASGEKKL